MRWLYPIALILWFVLEVGMGVSESTQSRSELLLLVNDAPSHGLVVAPVNLQPFGVRSSAVKLTAVVLPSGKSVPAQFVADGAQPGKGTLVLQLPRAGSWKLRLQAQPVATSSSRQADVVRTAHYEFHFSGDGQRGLPSAIHFARSGKHFDTFVWNDRVHHRELGSFHLRYDPNAQAELIADGELCMVVRVRASYCQPGGKRPFSQPQAVYHWYLFKQHPLVYVVAQVRQETPFAWDEYHFLELNFPDTSFTRWAGGEPIKTGEFTASQKSERFSDWGVLIEGDYAIGMWGEPILVYDGRGGYGSYLHSRWQAWSDTQQQVATWMWIGSSPNALDAVRQAAQQRFPAVRLTTSALRQQIEAFRRKAEHLRGQDRARRLWMVTLAERFEAQARFDEVRKLLKGDLPDKWQFFTGGDLGIALERTRQGIVLQSLFDIGRGRELLAPDNPPLFAVSLQETDTGQSALLTADSGWREVEVNRQAGGFELKWLAHGDGRFAGISVTVQARTDSRQHGVRWKLNIANKNRRWSLWKVKFPDVAVAELGQGSAVLFPRGPGEVQKDVWRRDFTFHSTYPNGWCAMQFMAAYNANNKPVGLYFGMHDPMGSTKDIGLRSQPAQRSVRMYYEHPVPNMGRALNAFVLNGHAVWQLLRGDWYDAARIYRAWVIREARWYPRKGTSNERHSPAWMRTLPAWALTGGTAEEVVSPVEQFAKYCDVPVAVHWYNWHEIPFDNDYPHYFPTKPGFAEGVRRLREAGVFVMPYINGRLWDTRDRKVEDFQFSAVAKPAATKNEKGEPYVESYGSKEEDGSDVRLAVMCPSTELWQNKVREVVMRLFNECGVSAVYIDQVAAAHPVLCFDPAHGHPLGGGHWWNEGYWRMLERIRRQMPADRALTTECNAEPFVHNFDAYLTWHWQHEGQVPAFPAVYSDVIQMFGRAYRGGDTKDLALRMKAAQQLVFGEQIGWIDPNILREEQNARFLRQMIQLRWRYRQFFTEGEMARPPRLHGNIPTVRADWQWAGEWWVSDSAVYTGAWQLPSARRMVCFFVNVADELVSASFRFVPTTFGVRGRQVKVREFLGEGEERGSFVLKAGAERTISIPAHSSVIWELSW